VPGSNLVGRYHVTPVAAALKEADDLFPKTNDYYRLRHCALNLRHWKQEGCDDCELDWDEIKGMAPPRACELRIDEEIGGYNNLRVIFYVFEKDIVLPGDVLPRLWTICVMQKKTERFSTRDFRVFKARITTLRHRNYADYL